MPSAVAFLFCWANAPFAFALGVVASFLLLQATGLLGALAGGDGDHDGNVDHDGGVDHDADVGHDADADHDADHDSDGDGDDASERASLAAVLGFGTLPLSMIWQTFALVAALTGYLLNLRYLGVPGGPPIVTLAWTLPASALAGGASVAALARWLGPVFSAKGQEATSRAQLVGQIGVVISTRVDTSFGEVRIRDKSGHDLRVVCKLASGAKSTPRERQSVVVVECDDGGGLLVEPLDDLEADEASRSTAG